MRKIGLFVLVLLLFFGCTQQVQQPAPENTAQTVQIAVKVFDGEQVLAEKTIAAQKGINGLDALKLATDVRTQKAAFGEFVTEIAGKEAGQTHYWALYIDGEYAQKGISDYTFENNTLMEWKLEAINPA